VIGRERRHQGVGRDGDGVSRRFTPRRPGGNHRPSQFSFGRSGFPEWDPRNGRIDGSGGPLQPIPPTRDSLVLLQIELKSYTLVLYTFQFPAFVWMMMVGRLSEFPWVIVRVDCPLCPHRRGQYRLARLVEKFGADIQLSELLDRIAFDCPRKSHPWEQPPNECDPKCKARFTDLEATSRPPPDLPPAMRKLTVILGGKS
jgi:hypothetical protein